MVANAVMWQPPNITGGEITSYGVRIYHRRSSAKEVVNQWVTAREWVTLNGTYSSEKTYLQV